MTTNLAPMLRRLLAAVCGRCNGTGFDPYTYRACALCGGSGQR